MRVGIGSKFVMGMAGIFALAACGGAEPVASTSDGLAGATFTTFDATRGGCLDSPNGVDCNHYTSKDRVYLSGGPAIGSLEDGTYLFAILAPGNPAAALSDTAPGNLSGAALSPMSQRTFRVANGEIVANSQSPTRGSGESPNGRYIIQAIPFADTPNPGGVYILAVCIEGATSQRDCKYDAFKVERKKECPKDGKDKDHKNGSHKDMYEKESDGWEECKNDSDGKDGHDGHGDHSSK